MKYYVEETKRTYVTVFIELIYILKTVETDNKQRNKVKIVLCLMEEKLKNHKAQKRDKECLLGRLII